MFELLLTTHSLLRWVVLLLGLAAITVAVMAAIGRRPWDEIADRAGLFYTISMDVQVVIGLLVWIVGQRWAGDWLTGWVHPLLMLGAVGLAHVGRRRADAANSDRERGRLAALFFGASLVVVLLAIPVYSCPLIGR